MYASMEIFILMDFATLTDLSKSVSIVINSEKNVVWGLAQTTVILSRMYVNYAAFVH